MSDYSSHIGIVGGGISGLTAGCTLLEQGHKTVIFERSKQLNQHGAGISVSPNAIANIACCKALNIKFCTAA